jgi:hypothetical protein
MWWIKEGNDSICGVKIEERRKLRAKKKKNAEKRKKDLSYRVLHTAIHRVFPALFLSRAMSSTFEIACKEMVRQHIKQSNTLSFILSC